jgi:cytoplasmic iron level regulating protein YaaA (DUF328/UPF0246 family)
MSYKIIISPTKNLNPAPIRKQIISQPYFIKEAELIANDLKTKTLEELSKLMKISNDIAHLNSNRFKNWKKSSEENREYHAIQMYSGEVFKAFDFQTFDSNRYEYLQNSLLILSGLYGVLKPFDLIYPYRLEMGLPYSPSKEFQNLYQFWNKKLMNYFQKNLNENDVIINLASLEYTKAISLNNLGFRVISPNFQEFKNGKYSMVTMFSKNARGKMARYILESQFSEIENLKAFNHDGYSYDEKLSTKDNWFFVR